jgi:dipeptidyl aminopeptidase/acylaminoacyl peptidase
MFLCPCISVSVTKHIAGKLTALALLLLLVLPTSTPAQQVSPLDVGDVLDIKTFGLYEPIQFSPDAHFLAYTVATKCQRNSNQSSPGQGWRTGVWPYLQHVEVFVANLTGGGTRNLTGCEGESWSPQWSPDGRYLAFVSDRDGSGLAKLWLWDRKTDKFRKLSDENVRTEQHHIRWLRSGRGVLVTVLPDGMTSAEFARRLSAPAHDNQSIVPGSSAMVYRSESGNDGESRAPASDSWNLDSYLADLAVVDVETSKLKRLTRNEHVGSYALSPDGNYLAFTSPQKFESAGSQQILWNLQLVSLMTHETRTLASDLRLEFDGSPFSWSPDGTQLAYLTTGMETDKNGTSDCFLVDVKGGTPRNITNFPKANLHSSTRRVLWSGGTDWVFFLREGTVWKASTRGNGPVALPAIPHHKIVEIVADDDSIVSSAGGASEILVLTDDELNHQSGFYSINLASGASETEMETGKCYTCVAVEPHVDVAPNGQQFAFFSEDAEHPSDLWTADQTFRNVRRITQLNPQLGKHQLGTAKLIDWRDLDGNPLRGTLLLPADYQVGKRYPLIAYVYGGSRGSRYVNHFGCASVEILNLQVLATRGFAVLFPDAPQRLGTPMIDLAKTILPAVNEVIRLGIADANRIGIFGHSYGGYSVLSLTVQTNRFKAAVMVDGKGDLVAEYGSMTKDGSTFGLSINEEGQGLMGGTPWQYRDRYIENSPIFFLDRIETPLLIIHGAEDQAVPAFLADEIFVDLRRLGKTVEYAKYTGEGHVPGLWSDANRLDYYQRVISWFQRYLTDSKPSP